MRTRFLILWLVAAFAAAALVFAPSAHVVHASPNGIVISAVYGAGGDNPETLYNNDYIELFNAGSVAVDVTGWTLQSRDTHVGGTWEKQALNFDPPGDGPNNVLQPGQYLLISGDSNNDRGLRGDPVPADIVGTFSVNPAGNVAVAIIRSNETITHGGSPFDDPEVAEDIEDVFGGGDSTVFEGAVATAGTPFADDNTAWYRDDHGCTDTNNNANDFTAGVAHPNARNLSTTLAPCAGGPGPSTELVSNGGFEEGSTNWTLNGNKAKVKCDGFGAGSPCGLLVKPGGTAKQQDMFDDMLGSTTTAAGDTLTVSADVKSTFSPSQIVVKVVVNYVTPTAGKKNDGKDRFKLKSGTTTGYDLRSKTFTLDDAITNGSVTIMNPVASGKVKIDNVSVGFSEASTRGVLPVPAAPGSR